MKRQLQNGRDGRSGELAEQIALLRDAGVEVTPDYLLGRITVTEAAEFLGTTPGEVYNLTSRRQIPFNRLGKRGVRLTAGPNPVAETTLEALRLFAKHRFGET